MKKIFTPEEARTETLEKIAKGAGKGAASPITAKTKEPKLAIYRQVLADLEAEGAIFADRSGAKPKYFLAQYAPTLDEARKVVLDKLTTAGATGAASPITATVKEPRRSLLVQALVDLEAEGAIFADRSGAKPKYFLAQYAPTVDEARRDVLGRLTSAGAAGAASLITAKTKEPKRSLLAQALAELESEGAIQVDRSKAPKYFLKEFAPQLPTVATVAEKLERSSALKHPALLTAEDLRKSLAKPEQPLSAEAVQALESSRRLVRLIHGKAVVYAHGDSLRAVLGVEVKAEAPPISAEAVRRAYAELVQRHGSIDVKIAALQREAGVPLEELKDWLRAEHARGRANFFTGDWSLSDEATQTGVIELRDERYLLVRLDG